MVPIFIGLLVNPQNFTQCDFKGGIRSFIFLLCKGCISGIRFPGSRSNPIKKNTEPDPICKIWGITPLALNIAIEMQFKRRGFMKMSFYAKNGSKSGPLAKLDLGYKISAKRFNKSEDHSLIWKDFTPTQVKTRYSKTSSI